MEIFHVRYADIDRQKWDACIYKAQHGSLYATAFYLDTMAGKWDALILGDYEMLMPLCRREKAGIRYLYQPAFLPQTGIFSKLPVTADVTEAFLEKAFSIFRFADIAIAFPLRPVTADKKLTIKKRNNYVVDLSGAYKKLSAAYAPGFKKSLKRLQKLSLQYAVSDDVKEITDMFISLYLEKIAGLKKAGVEKFAGLCRAMQENGNAVVRKVYSADQKLLCAVILLKFRNRLYNMISCVTAAGKKAEANYFLYDQLIREFSGKGLVLDLEGSDLKGIADFYKKMSPQCEPYFSVKYNNLNPVVNLFRKLTRRVGAFANRHLSGM